MPITFLTDPAPGLDEPTAISFSEVENYNGNTYTADVVLETPWDQRNGVMENILNASLPWPYASSPMVATTGSINPTPEILTSKDGSGNTYLSARLTINFQGEVGMGTGGPGESPVIFYESIEPNAEMLKTNPRSPSGEQLYYWGEFAVDEDAVTDQEAPTKILFGMDYVVKYMKLSSIPGIALTYMDCVNEGSITSPSLGLTFDDETLLWNPPKISRNVTAKLDANTFDMEARWSWRKNGWNKYWRAQSGTFEQIYLLRVGHEPVLIKNFEPVDMTDMLP